MKLGNCRDRFGNCACSDNGNSRCAGCGAPIFRVLTFVNGELYDVREAMDFAGLYRTGRRDIRHYTHVNAREHAANPLVARVTVTARVEDTRGNFIANVAR